MQAQPQRSDSGLLSVVKSWFYPRDSQVVRDVLQPVAVQVAQGAMDHSTALSYIRVRPQLVLALRSSLSAAFACLR